MQNINIILKNKLTHLLSQINNNSLELSTLYFADKEKYNALLKRLIDLRTSLFGGNCFVSKVINKLNSADFQYSKKEDIVYVKNDEKLIAILGKNIPKSPTLTSLRNSLKQIENVNSEEQVRETMNAELFNEDHLIKEVKIPLDGFNRIFVDLKIHSYRSYEPIPSILLIINEGQLYAYDFNDPKTPPIYGFLKTQEIICYQNNREYLIEYLGFSKDKVFEIQQGNVCQMPGLTYIDWRIRPINLLKEYLLLNLNPPLEKLNQKQTPINIPITRRGLLNKLETLRETLALENNESPVFILTMNQLNLIYRNRNYLFKREDVNDLLKLQSPIFRAHVMDFLLLLNNKERVYAKLCEEKKKQKL